MEIYKPVFIHKDRQLPQLDFGEMDSVTEAEKAVEVIEEKFCARCPIRTKCARPAVRGVNQRKVFATIAQGVHAGLTDEDIKAKALCIKEATAWAGSDLR